LGGCWRLIRFPVEQNIFVWNYLRFFLRDILNHPSCFDDEKANAPLLKIYFLKLSFSTGEFVLGHPLSLVE